MHFSRIYHTGPVTALYCHGNNILAGIGSQLHMYCIKHRELVGCVEVLPARVIHGIQPEGNIGQTSTKLCIYGQKCIHIVDFDPVSMTMKPDGDMTEFPDWIWDVSWFKNPDEQGDKMLGLALGHNVIVVYNVEKRCVTQTVHCQEKCILYCAKFLSYRPDCVIVAAGTVFNQVVIWSPQSTANTSGRIEPFHRLTGHQGVIFSVDFNRTSRLICSVSDDRSIRLYKLTFPESSSCSSNHSNTNETDNLDIGHQACDLDLSDWENMESTLLHVLYGHSARVWDVKLMTTCFVSIGEDSTCCVWSYEGQVMQKFKGHKGKSIWSMSVDKGENFIVTGGGDNSIRLWQLKEQGSNYGVQPKTRSLDLQLDPDDFPRNTKLLDTQRILVITNSGNLLLYNQLSDVCCCVMSDPAFSSYTLLEISPNRSLVSVANIHGTLRILSITGKSANTVCQVKVCEGKIFGLAWLTEELLLTTAPDGVVDIWRIDEAMLVKRFTLELPLSKHRWIVCASLIADDSCIVCGDRTGSVFVYSLDEERMTGELVQSFLKIHGKAGVTYIGCHGNHVYTAGRDGVYRTFERNINEQFNLLHTKKVFKGFDWIEKLVFTEDDDIHIHGFLSNLFVVWSVQQNQKVLQVECGGGHRAWDFCCHDNKSTFVYVKAREVKVTDMEIRLNQVIVKPCLHGRELCDAKFISTGTDHKGDAVYAVVTCSEDTAVCLAFLHKSNDNTELNVCQTLSGHISTVRCLYVCRSSLGSKEVTGNDNPSSYRKLIFSAGGRAQLKVWRVGLTFPHHNICNVKDLRNNDKIKAVPTAGNIKIPPTSVQDSLSHSFARCANECKNPVVIDDNIVSNLEPLQEEQNGAKGDYTSSCLLNSYGNSGIKAENLIPESYGCSYESLAVPESYSCGYECLASLQLSQITRRVKKPWRQQSDNSDPETRILDLSVVTSEEIGHKGSRSLYFIAAACSDGLFRLLTFEESTKEIAVIASSSYHDHSVLKVCHVIIPCDTSLSCDSACSEDKEHCTVSIVVLTAATDGKVAFWDITDICKECSASLTSDSTDRLSSEYYCDMKKESPGLSLTPFFSLDLHQSGINSLYFGKYSGDNYILVTGGDDNALQVNFVAMETRKEHLGILLISSGCELHAHAAQITGTWYVGWNQIVTASIDQRVCLWQFSSENTILKLKLIDSHFTSVSDVANIDVIANREDPAEVMILISGNGLEVLKMFINTSQQSDSSGLKAVTV